MQKDFTIIISLDKTIQKIRIIGKSSKKNNSFKKFITSILENNG